MTSRLKYLPLCQLKASRANMRKTDKLADIAQLAASIEANGLLENLVVHPLANGDTDNAHYEVVAGGRRLAALQRLAKAKKIERDHAVACLVVADAPAGTLIELSLTENFERVPAHPADQFAAFAKLHHDGRSAEDIAARFGITVAFVQQRLKLSSVSPRLIALYREGAMTLEQLTAFTLASDHRAQEEVWFDSGYDELPAHLIRRLLTRSQVEATDRRAVYVGLAAYEAAGGTIVRDLFDSEHEGYLTDSQLLDRLVAEKLAKAAEDVRGEGWSWVEVIAQSDYGQLARFRRIAPVEISLGDADETRIAELGARYDELVAIIEEDGDQTVSAELDAVTAELESFRVRKESWSEEDRARAGAILVLDQDGTVSIHRGLLRTGEGAKPDEAETKPSRREKTANAPFSEVLLMDLSNRIQP